jgi:hypothetical protein
MKLVLTVLALLAFTFPVGARTVMEVSTNRVVFYEAYQPVPGVTNFVQSDNDNIEFTTSSVVTDLSSTYINGASSVAVTAPPTGYIQWLRGGTESAFPTDDEIFLLTEPTADGTNSIFQRDSSVLYKITVSNLSNDDAVDNGVYDFWGFVGDEAGYRKSGGGSMENDGSRWEFEGVIYDWFSATNWSLPPETDWPVGNGGTPPILIYNSIWALSGEFKTNTYSDLVANPQGTNGVYVKYDSSSNITEIITYPEVLSASQHEEAINYLNGIFLPDMDLSGVPDVDLSGFDGFNAPIAVGTSSRAGTPEISEWTRGGEAGDTLILTGENL